MVDLIVAFIIAGVLLAAEYLLCTKLKNPLWGGIIPILILAGTIYAFASGRIPLTTKTIFPFVVVNTIYWLDWAGGREKRKKLRQAEINKMKAKDM